jgi:signal transduction histidine kinase
VVVADIRDDGVGFTPSGTDGFGLTATRQRVSRLSGQVEVEPAPGRGAAVSVSVPAMSLASVYRVPAEDAEPAGA